MKNKERLAGRLIASMYVLGLLGMFCVVIGVHFTRQSDMVEDGVSDYIIMAGQDTMEAIIIRADNIEGIASAG